MQSMALSESEVKCECIANASSLIMWINEFAEISLSACLKSALQAIIFQSHTLSS